MNRRTFIKLSGAAAVVSRVRSLGAAELNRLKVGVISDEISDDLEAALRFLQSYGLRYVEIRKVWDTFITDLDDVAVRKVRALLDKYKMIVPMMDTGYLKTVLPGAKIIEIDPEDWKFSNSLYKDQPSILERSIARAQEIGAPAIRVFSFWRTTAPMRLLDPIAEHLAIAVETAARGKVGIALENEYSTNICSGDEISAIFKRVPHPNLSLNWDAGNTFALGLTPYPDEYNKIPKGRIRHTHLKDAANKNTWLPIGKGKIDYQGQLRALLKDGYQGMFSVETHYKHPSGNKELATKESLEGLLSILKRV